MNYYRTTQALSKIPKKRKTIEVVYKKLLYEITHSGLDFDNKIVPCECCKFPTLGYGDVCMECGWEQQESVYWTGANPVSLRTYKKLYKEIKNNG